MSFKIEEKIYECILQDVQSIGYDIEYIEYVKEGKDNILRLVIDKANSDISIDDCEKVSRYIDEKVEKNMKDEAYVLEVSSPGLERQLKNSRLYKKYIGKNIHIKVFKKTEYGKEFDAKLIDYIDDTHEVVVQIIDDENKENIILNLKDISSAYTIYDFDALLKEKNNK